MDQMKTNLWMFPVAPFVKYRHINNYIDYCNTIKTSKLVKSRKWIFRGKWTTIAIVLVPQPVVVGKLSFHCKIGSIDIVTNMWYYFWTLIDIWERFWCGSVSPHGGGKVNQGVGKMKLGVVIHTWVVSLWNYWRSRANTSAVKTCHMVSCIPLLSWMDI